MDTAHHSFIGYKSCVDTDASGDGVFYANCGRDEFYRRFKRRFHPL